ncbi:MAG: hypothetical protein IPN08_08370 [Bacteroidales bacterium]|nr:hypothetical protein [Bacteroidales bacterium]
MKLFSIFSASILKLWSMAVYYYWLICQQRCNQAFTGHVGGFTLAVGMVFTYMKLIPKHSPWDNSSIPLTSGCKFSNSILIVLRPVIAPPCLTGSDSVCLLVVALIVASWFGKPKIMCLRI